MSVKTYTDDEKNMACEIAQREGLSAGAKAVDATKPSVMHWLRARGIDPGELNAKLTADTRNATEASAAARRARLEAFRAEMTELLTEGATKAANHAIDRMDTSSPELPALVGMFTRAIHDLMLLNGEATNRTEIVEAEERARQVLDSLDELKERRARKAG